jgi:hypothetical protein
MPFYRLALSVAIFLHAVSIMKCYVINWEHERYIFIIHELVEIWNELP